MKRTKQAEMMITEVNEYLKNNHINDESNITFIVMSHALIRAGIYSGYIEYTKEGKCSGGVNTDYIQLV